ncbi:MAG: alpha/beta hydrolase [Erysipelotrichaceae bacterium]|nr:alpha/beta hydrolase [Erysipelotrichaceae bacterium]
MFVTVNDISLYYEVKGEGQPLMMVHGNSETHEIFDVASEVLKDYYKVYLIDSRDHGQSDKVKELHYDDMADDMVKFMEELDLKDVVYYGFSDGGIIGLLAAMKTDRISRMVLSGANMTVNGVKPALKLLIKVLYFFTKDQKMEMMLREPDIKPEDLKKISVPVSVVAGEKDMVTYEETKLIADSIPEAKLRIIPKAGHGSYIVHKKDIADIILEETGKK